MTICPYKWVIIGGGAVMAAFAAFRVVSPTADHDGDDLDDLFAL
jgi:hypothetical protein